MNTRIPRIVGALCAFLIVLEISFIWFYFSEACDDALKHIPPRQFVPMGKVVLAIAPFGLFPVLTPTVAAVVYWRLTVESAPRAHELVFPILLAIFGLMGIVLSAEYTKEFLYMDGGKSGTLAAWLFNGFLNAGMLWSIQRSWRTKNSGQ